MLVSACRLSFLDERAGRGRVESHCLALVKIETVSCLEAKKCSDLPAGLRRCGLQLGAVVASICGDKLMARRVRLRLPYCLSKTNKRQLIKQERGVIQSMWKRRTGECMRHIWSHNYFHETSADARRPASYQTQRAFFRSFPKGGNNKRAPYSRACSSDSLSLSRSATAICCWCPAPG